MAQKIIIRRDNLNMLDTPAWVSFIAWQKGLHHMLADMPLKKFFPLTWGLEEKIEKGYLHTWSRIVSDAFNSSPSLFPSLKNGANDFPVNIAEHEEYFLIEAIIEGLSSKDLDICIANDLLIIKGKRSLPSRSDLKSCAKDTSLKSFKRFVVFPDNADFGSAVAELKEPVLEIRIQKKLPETSEKSLNASITVKDAKTLRQLNA